MTVGIVGAGQLGRMMALAGYPLGLDFLFLDPASSHRRAAAPRSSRAPSTTAPRLRLWRRAAKW